MLFRLSKSSIVALVNRSIIFKFDFSKIYDNINMRVLKFSQLLAVLFTLCVVVGCADDKAIASEGGDVTPPKPPVVENNDFSFSVLREAEHPRILFRSEDENRVKSLIAANSLYENIHSYIIRECEALLTQPIYDYSITKPDEGIFLKTILYLSYAYRMTGETTYLNRAEQELLEMSASETNFYPLNKAAISFAAAIGYDWLYSNLKESTRIALRSFILNRMVKTSIDTSQAFWTLTSNWNQICISGFSIGAMAIYGDGVTGDDVSCETIIDLISEMNPNSMNMYSKGSYPEGPMYWSYGNTYEVLLLSTLEGIYGADNRELTKLIDSPGFLQSAEFMMYATGTSGYAYNHSDAIKVRPPAPAAIWMASRAKRPDWLLLERGYMEGGYYTNAKHFGEIRLLPIALIYGVDISMDNIVPPTKKLWYDDESIHPVCMVRTSWQGSNGLYMACKGGTPNYSHAHMDAGSFVYDAQGQRWAIEFEKEDYNAMSAQYGSTKYNQDSQRWNTFRYSNVNHNTISIRKRGELAWQHHNANGKAQFNEIIDTENAKGVEIDMSDMLGLSGEIKDASSKITVEDDAYLKVVDHIQNGSSDIDLRWNMATTASASRRDANTIELTQMGKTVLLEVSSSDPSITPIIETNRSTDPVSYNPAATWERKNPGTVMVGFVAQIPASKSVSFTVTIKNEIESLSDKSSNEITLTPPSPARQWAEGASHMVDISKLFVDSEGEFSLGGVAANHAWQIEGNSDIQELLDNDFSFILSAMGDLSLEDDDSYGQMKTPCGIDRNNGGMLGTLAGANAGINGREGYQVGLDLTRISDDVKIKIVGVQIGECSNTRSGEIVNRRDVKKRRSFGGSGAGKDVVISGQGWVDVTDLDIELSGGESELDLMSVFNPRNPGDPDFGEHFRVNGFKLKFIEVR